VYYIDNTHRRESEMNVLRNIEARDWVIGVVAFLAGAWIF